MKFHLPRRHRRKLLLPPGLLALAGLLWLGSVEAGKWEKQLNPRYVVELRMPVRPILRHPSFPNIRFEVPVPDEICKSCDWHNACLTGNFATDKLEQLRIEQDVGHIISDTMHAGGIRVKLTPTAHYTSMIFLLNLMLEKRVRKYWFDITRSPTTFYAITDAYNPSDKYIISGQNWRCLFSYNPPPVPFWVSFDNQVREFWQLKWLQPLWQPEWQASLWLLATIAALSSWRIIRAWRTT